MELQVAGRWFRSDSRYGPLFHAELRPATENSGKRVTMMKQQARLLALDEGYELVIIDGPPGIGCPVIAAAAGVDLALFVLPTPSPARTLYPAPALLEPEDNSSHTGAVTFRWQSVGELRADEVYDYPNVHEHAATLSV